MAATKMAGEDKHQGPTPGPAVDHGEGSKAERAAAKRAGEVAPPEVGALQFRSGATPPDKRGVRNEPATMKLKSPTDEAVSVGLLSGEGILIGPEGRDVPVRFRKEALIAGCIPADRSAEDMQHSTAEATEKDRQTILRAALRKMRDEGTPLTGAGLPHRDKVSEAVGWNVSAVELADAWNSLDA